MTASSNSFVARNVVGPEYNFSYWNFVQKDLTKTWWTTLAKKTLAETSDLSAMMASTRLANSSYVKQQRSLTDVLIAPLPLDGAPAPHYIGQLAALGWQALRSAAPSTAPTPLFFLLLRHTALRQYMDSALDLLTAAGAAQPAERIEAELLGYSTAIRPTAWALLARTLPGHGAVGAFLDGAKRDATIPAFAAFWNAFAQLSGYSAADLDAAVREVFDLASYRLDAWISSLAYARLESLRAANPTGGIVLGSYGWLENVRPAAATSCFGWICSRSIAQSGDYRGGYARRLPCTQRRGATAFRDRPVVRKG